MNFLFLFVGLFGFSILRGLGGFLVIFEIFCPFLHLSWLSK
jgi:hypothetical protein